MPAVISKILENSIANDLDLKQGDIIVAMNDNILNDYLDYKFEVQSEFIDLHIKRKNGEEEVIEIEKDFDEDLGIVFESAVFDKVKPCTNKCIFCFVDQQPKGLRDTLYIKDDDYRLSYMQGTYVTLTNLNDKDRLRIEALSLGPLYVSVHTTNPNLRVEMLKNPKAANILDELKWLNSIGIPLHTQIVLCPEINDRKELEKTLQDLYRLSNIQSIAIVPVGITKYRKDDVLKQITKTSALKVIKLVNEFNKNAKANIAFCSDEFYFASGKDYPIDSYYNGYFQLEDGIGTSRLVLDDFKKREPYLPERLPFESTFTIATGEIAAKTFEPIVSRLNRIENLNLEIIAIQNNFFGKTVTVAGLLTGSDFELVLKGVKNKEILIPSVAIRPYTDKFLDDMTVNELSCKTNKNIVKMEDYYSCKSLVDYVLALS